MVRKPRARRFKRFLKWAAGVIAIILLIPVLGVLSVWGLYESIVSSKPGALAVKLRPGELGANVNVFVGTGGVPWVCGHDTPAAAVPFGMVRLGPDTASIITRSTGLNRAGYYYGDNKIIGFSHTRLVGADALEGGVFRIFPTVDSQVERLRGKERYQSFTHREEVAFPGYYAVRLPEDGILAELTATTRVGVHRYTFDARRADAPHLLLDVTSALGDKRCKNGQVHILPEAHEVEGQARLFGSFSQRYGGLDVYFVARFSRPFATFGAWKETAFTPNATETTGDGIGVDLGFAESNGDAIEVRLALSYVSIANARSNLEAEAAAPRSFEEVAVAARDAWEKRLQTIRVEGGSERQRRIFYTALYHAFQMPTTFNDVNGEYIGFDRAVHKAEGFRYYTDFSLWDSFRTVHPLYNLIARDDERDMMVSLVEMAKAGGCLPRWPSGCGYTNCMFGTPADVAVTEAYLKGVRDFDIETAYQSMRQVALVGKPAGTRFSGREGLEWYLQYGYCPSDKMNESVSATLEYASEDYALSLLARELGHDEDADILEKHAQSYHNLWNPARQFFEPKDTRGDFPQKVNPLLLSYIDFKGEYTRGYVEGSGMQWRWFVPHDPDGLIYLFSSPEYFESELNAYLAKSNATLGWWNPGPYYWHGNEPYIHAAYLFNALGRPELTEKWVRHILETKYSDDYVGLDGNDDGGTLSAWYVFSALGFYPVAGTTQYQVGSPLFDKAEIHMGDKVLTILAENNGPENVYVQRAWLNGEPLRRPSFTHDEIAEGGVLRFRMSAALSEGQFEDRHH